MHRGRWLLGLLAGGLALSGCATTKQQQLAAELDKSGFETRIDDRGVTVLVTDVLFDYDSDALTAAGTEAVGKIAEIVQKFAKDNDLICEGHTDHRGTEAYNFELSLRRARRVAGALAGAGIAKEKISSQGLGETRPLVKETNPDGSDDPAGRARNRRVEVVIANTD
jgi:outer membrane protein OmpA-like peptidoglycan-associated protein